MSPQQIFPFGRPEGTPYRMGRRCPNCGGTDGVYREEGQHLVGWCVECGHRQRGYVRRTDANLAPRTTATIRRGVSAGQRRWIYERDGHRCVICVLGDPDAPELPFERFEVGHVISVSETIAFGLTDDQANDELNLVGMCIPHNAELGPVGISETLWLRILIDRRERAR